MLYYILAACLIYCLTLAYFFIPSPYQEGSKFAKKNQTVAILVLGDIGRSPRMQYHAASLSKAGFKVQIIGYKGTQPHASLLADQNIQYSFVPDVPAALVNGRPWLFPIFGPLKVLHQLFFLIIILGYAIDPPAYILVQNPPSIPSLALAGLISAIRQSRLVIDWHNLGFSILGLKLGNEHPMVTLSRSYEFLFGKSAYAHLTVTESMATFLKEEIKTRGMVKTLHDRPPTQFQPLGVPARTEFLRACIATADFDSTTQKLIVSSTSWTPDEDFQVLLDALVTYDAAAQLGIRKPRLLAVITGKGPMKEHYQTLIAQLSLKSVTVRCAWLSAEDYPKLLASADLGISLHTSSSGLDLPMKIVDMFGCGLPVLAMRFPSIHELVIEGLNGRTFSDAEDLAQCLTGLFANEDGSAHLESMREGAIKEGNSRWDAEWTKIAGPVFERRG